MNSIIKKAIEQSDMILIGIGEELSVQPPEYDGDPVLEPYMRSVFYADIPKEHNVIRAYNRLRECIGEKPYFAVTLNTDDLIYRSEFDPQYIVAPCGSMGKMQCEEHIVEAEGIRTQILKANEEGLLSEECIKKIARCPICGRPLQFHTIGTEGYLEEGYLPQWEKYKKWLSCTLNRRLCILELGVGFAFLQIIRWPFEKTALYNQKAVFVRVNSHFPQVEAEIADRAYSIPKNPVQALTEDAEGL